MSSYTAEGYADLVTTTLRQMDKVKWTDLATDLQRFVVMPRILRKKSVETEDGGYGFQFNVRVGTNNAARNVRLNEEDTPTTADVMITGNAPWRHSETYYAMNEIIQKMNSGGGTQLVSLLKTSRVDALTAWAELEEQNFWTKPDDSTDEVKPFGVPYWVVKATDTNGDHVGGNPSGFTSGAGNISSTTYTRWKNFTGNYTLVTKDDLIKKLRRALYKCEFRPPVAYPSATGATPGGGYQNWALFTVYDTVSAMESILETQNDNLGNDVAAKDGMVHVRRIPVEPVPYLDANDNTQKPIYGLSWNSWAIKFLSGEYMRESEVRPHPFNHRTYVVYYDTTRNYLCRDRRQNFVLYINA